MNKSKVFMIVSIITLILAVVGGVSTYAWYVWNTSEEEQTKIVTSVGAATVYYDSGASITGQKLKPVEDKSQGIVKEINVKSNVTNDLRFNLYLDINSLDAGLHHSSFRFAFYEGETLIKEGNFSDEYLVEPNIKSCDINGVNHIILLQNKEITKTLSTYTLYIWIDGTVDNPESMQSQNFDFVLHADGEDAVLKEGKIPDITETIEGSLAYQLVSTYNSAEKVDTTNNSIIYHYDRTNRLMSDVAGNLRFFGADDTSVSDDLKNYIYFNCDDYSNQSESTCEVWRIIGVFDGKVKIMRNSLIGKLAWDQDKNQDSSLKTYNNDWSTSSLQEFLNGKYYDRGEDTTYTYYTGSSGSSSVSLNLENIGIKNDTTRGLISESLWYLKGWDSNSIYSDQMYDYERNSGKVYNANSPTTLLRNIGIPYVSDYGYAADLGSCSGKTLSKYDDTTCTSANWMKPILGTSSYGWLMAPFSSYSDIAWVVFSSGGVGSSSVYNARGVAPVLHLNSELGIKTGDGSQDTPYQIAIG